jgi:kojibiose phosphorylase
MATMGRTVAIENLLIVFTSEVESPVTAAQEKTYTLPDYSTVLSAHEQAWNQNWEASDIVIEGDVRAQLAVRYNLFQLLIAAPRRDVGSNIPAKKHWRGLDIIKAFFGTPNLYSAVFTYTQPAIAAIF